MKEDRKKETKKTEREKIGLWGPNSSNFHADYKENIRSRGVLCLSVVRRFSLTSVQTDFLPPPMCVDLDYINLRPVCWK